MGKETNISWCHHTANFWHGCQRWSPGCQNCYAETFSNRMGKHIWGPPATTDREYKKGVWSELLKWDKQAGRDGERRRLFVQSMSDFLEDHPQVTELRNRAIDLLENLQNLDVLLLTKRLENAPKFLSTWYNNWPSHVWMGVSVENQEYADKRIPLLVDIPAKIRFLSCEPLLGKVVLPVIESYVFPDGFENNGPIMPHGIGVYENPDDFIHWVIVGGESGNGCSPMQVEWAQSLHDQCKQSSVAFFMKQDSGLRSGMRGRLSDELWNCKEFPA